MTSTRKVEANRENALRSTGPKTRQGRARVARNALRHGLSLPVYSDLGLSEEMQALAHKIAGAEANGEMRALAYRIAEAHIELCRVRDARHRLLSEALSDPYYDSGANLRQKMAVLGRLLRGNSPEVPIAALVKYVTKTPEGDDKLALILSQELHRLSIMHGYERRALSRRKFAVRAFDSAKRHLLAAGQR